MIEVEKLKKKLKNLRKSQEELSTINVFRQNIYIQWYCHRVHGRLSRRLSSWHLSTARHGLLQAEIKLHSD